jgi:hypothetical protein
MVLRMAERCRGVHREGKDEMSVGIWHDRAWQAIEKMHAALPPDATLAERKKALTAAYPFGERRHFPFKAWCKARRQYLARYEPPKPIPEHLLTLFR